jgi:hypothetical protein
MKRHIKTALLGAAAAMAMTAGASSAVAATNSEHAPCFFITQWNGWKAPSPTVVYLGVNMHDVYRLDLAAPSPQLQWPDVHLVSVNRGSNSICSAIDLQLAVSDNHGFKQPLFPKRLTKLTPEEVAAIPKQFRPN